MKKTGKNHKKILALTQILSLMIEIFAISFIIGGMSIGTSSIVNAETTNFVPSGCCTETIDGSVCQEMNLLDSGNCKTNLLATSCNQVETCQIGCCYDRLEGSCSLNAPKQKCQDNGGNWSKDATCNIQECQLGCCVLGDQASVTTPRECTKISRELNFEKNYQPLDSDGSCNSKVGLSKKGACLTSTGDFSGENDCKFTTKEKCSTGNFYEGYLCTSKALNTNCFPSKTTTCTEDSDRVYYLDTCKNLANVYDASKYSDNSYWEKIISPESSCGPANNDPNCGNCDYSSGSVCYQYRMGKDAKPTYGDNICRNLNCVNGKKHGESWCISDYSNAETPGVTPIGSRWFTGSCLDGEISVSPCADYNQETCIQSEGTSFSEAKCIVNEWRNCIAANEKESYALVAQECKKYPECTMFFDIPGNEKYENLPGFKKDIDNVEQGNAGDIGKDMNKVIPWCVAKNTGGMVFWPTEQKTKFSVPGAKTTTQTNTQANSGGSLEETKAICALGSFTCVSHTQKKPAATGSWKDKENPECNIYAADQNNQKVELMMEALNERCRMLGPCGINVNIAGEVNSQESNGTVKIEKINAKGKSEKQDASKYLASEDYINSISGKSGLITAGSLTSLATALVLSIITGKATEPSSSSTATRNNPTQIRGEASGAIGEANPSRTMETTVAGTLGALAISQGAAATTSGIIAAGSVLAPGSTVTFASATTLVSGVETISVTAGTTRAIPSTGTAATVLTATEVTGATLSSGSTLASGSTIGGASILYSIGMTLAAAAAGYMVGQLIGKWMGMSPGKTSALSNSLAAGAGLATLASTGTFYGATSSGAAIGTSGGLWTGYSAGSYLISVCWLCVMVVIIAMLATYLFTGEDNEYYITSYTCEPWSPPAQGNCNSCNNDIRTCSEYRCKSLGLNCQYFNDNGEPGWCASTDDIWSATIKPWPEGISEGYKYSDVGEMKFTIESSDKPEVQKGSGFQFGVITSKQAQCKIDNKHTTSIDEMSTDMLIDSATGCDSGSCINQGTYHKIGLSSSFTTNSNSTSDSEGGSTIALKEGENELYIRCKNYAGQYNKAEFVVRVIVGEEPDYTPPTIMSFSPASNSYLKVGSNSSSAIFYVNEPAECKYSQGKNMRFEEMNSTAFCINNLDSAILSRQPCYVVLKNLTMGSNKFYFQCKDQPELTERIAEMRNINRNSKEYSLNVCTRGLNITRISPEGQIITGKSPINVTLEVETSGCINDGDSTCYYQFGNESRISFINTGKKLHTQIFDNLPSGNHNVNVYCEDEAGNSDTKSININVNLDNDAPFIIKSFNLGQYLYILTNEDSECSYNSNSTLGCEFKINENNSSLMSGTEKIHFAPYNPNQEYFIKCQDIYGNTNFDCGIKLKTYELQKE